MAERSRQLPRPEPPPGYATARPGPTGQAGKRSERDDQSRGRQSSGNRSMVQARETAIYRGLCCVGTITSSGDRHEARDADDEVIGTFPRFRDAAAVVLAEVLPHREGGWQHATGSGGGR